MARKKKVELTRSEIIINTLTTLSDWKVKCDRLNQSARWKELHDFSEALRREHLDKLYQDATKSLELVDLMVIKGIIEKWFPEESKGVGWWRNLLVERIVESARKEKERGKR